MSRVSMDKQGARRALGFVKTTLVGGVVFLVPLFVLVVLGAKAASLLRRLALPLAAHLPLDSVLGVLSADAIIIVLVVLACFGAGLLARVSFARSIVKKAEAGVLWRIPGYGFIKGLTASLDQSAAASAMRPVLAHFDDADQLAFEVEQLADGRRVLYVPSAPDPRAGAVVVMDQNRVESVPISFVAALGSLRTLGRGFGACLSPRTAAPSTNAPRARAPLPAAVMPGTRSSDSASR